MKEKYNSERHLKTNFESHSFPFDQEAFRKFQEELDKNDKKRKAGWWKGLSLLLVAIFIVAIVSANFFFPNSMDSAQEKSSSKMEIKEGEIIDPPTEDRANSEKTVLNNSQNAISASGELIVNRNIEAEDSKKEATSSVNTFPTRSSSQKPILENTEERISSFSQNTITTNDFGSELNSSPSRFEESESDSQLIAKVASGNDPSSIQIQDPLSIDLLPIRAPSLIEKLRNELNHPSEIIVKPSTHSSEKYFYLSARVGMVINDNFGTDDPYLSIRKTREFTYGGLIGYQFNPSYSVELSLVQHEFSFGYKAKGFTYDTKSGGKATVLKASLVNHIWSPFQGIQFNMTNGIGAFYGRDGSYSKSTSGSSTPEFIEKAMLTSLNINSGWRLMYSGGLQLNFNLSQNLECTFNSEYTLGFKTWSDSQLTYIEGEGGSGQNRHVAAFSKGNYYSFTLGLKYILKE